MRPTNYLFCSPGWTRRIHSITGLLEAVREPLSPPPSRGMRSFVSRTTSPDLGDVNWVTVQWPEGRNFLPIRLFLSPGSGAKRISASSCSSSRHNRRRKIPLSGSSSLQSPRQKACSRSSSWIVPWCFFSHHSFWVLLFIYGSVIIRSAKWTLTRFIGRIETQQGYCQVWVVRKETETDATERVESCREKFQKAI